MICITDGYGGMDCSMADGSRLYLPPSKSGNMWATTQSDMQNLLSWCYGSPPGMTALALEAKMRMIQIERF